MLKIQVRYKDDILTLLTERNMKGMKEKLIKELFCSKVVSF